MGRLSVDIPPVTIKQLGYILLLPVYFLLHAYNELFAFIPVPYLLTFGLFIYIFAGIAFLIALLLTRSILIASFITFCCLLFSLFFGAWHDFVISITNRSVISKYIVIVPVSLLLLIAATWYFIKKPLALQKFSNYISLVVLILCCLDIVNWFLHLQQFRKDNNLIYPDRPVCNAYVPCNQPDSLKPDIYFIIFDEYTNNQTLQKIWQYDNSAITQWLSEKGFYCSDSSKSNYNFTPYSISSIFNMNYLTVGEVKLRDLPVYLLKAVKSMSDNETICMLQKEHYGIRFISPFKNRFETLPVGYIFGSFPKEKLYSHTFPGRVEEDLGWLINKDTSGAYIQMGRDYDLIVQKIKSTVNPSSNRPPQFVYGHLMTTHGPHLYDSLGRIRPFEEIRRGGLLYGTYLNQIKQANKKMKELVGHILTHNKRNTLLILMGDHGFRQFPDSQSYNSYPNFCAFYFPDQKYGRLLTNISAVNTFRIVFNQYFCQNLPLLKDSSILVKY